MIYKMKDTAHYREGFDREAGAGRLAAILERDGRLETAAIIADGIQPESPLHPQFTMNADEALQSLWVIEARYLQRSFIVVKTLESGEKREYRAVTPVYTRADADTRRFVSTIDAMADPEYRAQILHRALVDLLSLRRKYADLQELATVFQAIDKVAKVIRAA